ncbi:hypothetical protein CHL76_08770 [Marinococcus halophilus]|uniref:Uncharacterized protein n=1 Tax=Marinococcus halophilus TaxID=1371 RepID=A0A510Y695_MARHA|nr:hypothetical protein [Marinococcus halophilus]OZT80188.1 hypothetical protein CHL76_08770 [Marinococcus halophilus]GEK58241.1 hypothetical protein MHA01_11460 [Marinococcus halophilus]
MTSWLQLWKKEFALTRSVFYWCLALIFFVVIFAVVMNSGNFLSVNANNPAQRVGSVVLGSLSAGIFAHFVYLPIYMIVSLELERRQMHLWLYQPQPLAKMLSAKYASGLTCASISLFINGLLLLLASWMTPGLPPFFGLLEEGVTWMQLLALCLLCAVFVLLVSLYFSVYLLFIYAFDFAYRHTLGKGLQIVLAIAAVVLLSILANLGLGDVYQAITSWGQFSLTGLVNVEFFNLNLYAGVIVFHAVIGTILFILSAQLIDKKAEV